MKYVAIITTVLALSACSSDPTTTKNAENIACAIDALAVPLAVAAADGVAAGDPSLATSTQTAVTADGPVHAQVQKTCATLTGNN